MHPSRSHQTLQAWQRFLTTPLEVYLQDHLQTNLEAYLLQLTVITPGNNKTEILRVIQSLALEFDQVVLLGYPPFLKDVIDTGLAQEVDWRPYHVKLVMAGEVFIEEWRSLVGNRLGYTNFCFDSASLYAPPMQECWATKHR